MSITRIISGGQTGADQGALDAAIRLNVSHGGWIPKARSSDAAFLDPERYGLTIMESTGYANFAQCRERNVMDADGSLILSCGPLQGPCAMTDRLARKHKKPVYQYDLDVYTDLTGIRKIHQWSLDNAICTLNVCGPLERENKDIYKEALHVIESLLRLSQIADEEKKINADDRTAAPRTAEEAVQILLRDLPLKDRSTIANMSAAELPLLDATIGKHIRARFELVNPQSPLVRSCAFLEGRPSLGESEASAVILRELAHRLHQTHRLRVVK